MVNRFRWFAYPYPVKLISVTPGYTEQPSGNWIPESITESDVDIMVQNITVEDLQLVEVGTVEAGDKKITIESSAGLKVRDRLRIYEKEPDEQDSDPTIRPEWEVTTKLQAPRTKAKCIKMDFETYLIRRRIT